MRFSRKGNAEQLKIDGDLKERGTTFQKRWSVWNYKGQTVRLREALDGQGRRQERGGEV